MSALHCEPLFQSAGRGMGFRPVATGQFPAEGETESVESGAGGVDETLSIAAGRKDRGREPRALFAANRQMAGSGQRVVLAEASRQRQNRRRCTAALRPGALEAGLFCRDAESGTGAILPDPDKFLSGHRGWLVGLRHFQKL